MDNNGITQIDKTFEYESVTLNVSGAVVTKGNDLQLNTLTVKVL